jgi:hypothetical protein
MNPKRLDHLPHPSNRKISDEGEEEVVKKKRRIKGINIFEERSRG